MSAKVGGVENLRLALQRSRNTQASARFYKLSHLRKLRGSEQVAAVCYRISPSGIEFLLVQTRGGRWTFPKGGVEPGLTHAQAAALEAFEEAGVHGRMEEAPFARYIRGRSEANRKRKNNDKDDRRRARPISKSVGKETVVSAHLCEVLRLTSPQESGRNPSWFPAKKAKRCLGQDRSANHASDLAHIVDRAVTRIQRLTLGTTTTKEGTVLAPSQALASARDPLHRVQFEAAQLMNYRGATQEVSQALFTRYIRRQRGSVQPSAAIELAVNAYLSKVLQSSPAELPEGSVTFSTVKAKRRPPQARGYEGQIPPAIAQAITRVPQLRSGNPVDHLNKVTQIDKGRKAAGKSKASREP
jgi:8-oxo-dGTP pyrophosphatase MutT (NUDIX family)